MQPAPEPEAVSVSQAAVAREVGSLHNLPEATFTFTILGFGLLALLFLYLISRKTGATPFLLRVYVITIIVFGTLAAVSSAYTTDQIGAVVGLFGTIAGYILGRSEKTSTHDPD